MIQPIAVHTPGPARRLQAVLSPVIPELAALVRDTPGSLSLAQGMVDWAPPESVAPAVAAALAAGVAVAGVTVAAALTSMPTTPRVSSSITMSTSFCSLSR